MENNIEMIENILNTERRNRRGNREIRFEVNSNYYKAVSKLLSDYKRALKENERLQKENEELKQDRNNNYQMIALAQNEVLGYMQGYEDGKKLNRSAVACVVENQQYYIIKKKIEHYKEHIVKLQKENEELREDRDKFKKALGKRITYCNELEKDLFENGSNYVIPKQKVKEKIEELIKEGRHYNANKIEVLQELLESEE